MRCLQQAVRVTHYHDSLRGKSRCNSSCSNGTDPISKEIHMELKHRVFHIYECAEDAVVSFV